MSYSLSTISRHPSVERTIDDIRKQIEGGAWPGGARIPNEQDLAVMLDAALHTVREAVRILSSIDVLDVRRNEGTFVASRLDRGDITRRLGLLSLRDHLDLRAMLEAEAARRAARNRTDADMEVLHSLLADRGEVSDHEELEEFIACDLAFHEAIARMSGNEALSALYRYFTLTIDANMQAVLGDHEFLESGMASHLRLLTAIQDGDTDAAANAARAIAAPLLQHLSPRRH
ncbi:MULTISPECIES: FadR/GntR family transcriptional regulator [Agrobacterium]|uniref:FadR/GntR family transcriptional regulator n=1 Tax=Agrobacterium tumefaciens TaxID=358 RepID=UPI000EF2594B|nr:FadR family transcriptional regulator [Agrobacterium tumefaciens]NSY93323.1 FadR family transcriptional regulator [Agrobacterium tumefaciens]